MGRFEWPFFFIYTGFSALLYAGATDADLTTDLLDPDAPKRSAAERATDTIRAKFGKEAIIKGRALR